MIIVAPVVNMWVYKLRISRGPFLGSNCAVDETERIEKEILSLNNDGLHNTVHAFGPRSCICM